MKRQTSSKEHCEPRLLQPPHTSPTPHHPWGGRGEVPPTQWLPWGRTEPWDHLTSLESKWHFRSSLGLNLELHRAPHTEPAAWRPSVCWAMRAANNLARAYLTGGNGFVAMAKLNCLFDYELLRESIKKRQVTSSGSIKMGSLTEGRSVQKETVVITDSN